jgi:hypothetical protein
MRNVASLLGTLLLVACSLDHVVVAALDAAGAGNVGGSSESAGGAGLSASATDHDPSGGARPSGGGAQGGSAGGGIAQGGTDRIILGFGGSNVDVRIGGDAGSTSEIVCSCLGEQAQLCSSDGVTFAAGCEEDAGACLAPTISCWHACPCLEGESANTRVSSWFPADCAPTAQCADGPVCMTFTNVTHDVHICTTTGN